MTRRRLTAIIPFIVLFAGIAPAFGQFGLEPARPKTPTSASDVSTVRISADAETITAGMTFHVLVRFTIAPKWHIYWENPGAAGMATSIAVDAPDGFTVGETLFPRPLSFDEPEGTTFGYSADVVLFVPVTAPAALTNGPIDLNVRVDYLVCRTACLIGNASTTIRVDTGAAHRPAPVPEVVTTWRARLPKPLPDLVGAGMRVRRDTLSIIVPNVGDETVSFMPSVTPGVTYGTPDVATRDDITLISIPLTVKPGNSLGEPLRVRGLLLFGTSPDDPCFVLSRRLGER